MVFIDHVGIRVAEADLEACVAFYLAALEPLNYKELMRFPGPKGTAVGFGAVGSHADFWVTGQAEKPNTIIHVAFSAGQSSHSPLLPPFFPVL
jgi:lactoylglutathione lyase